MVDLFFFLTFSPFSFISPFLFTSALIAPVTLLIHYFVSILLSFIIYPKYLNFCTSSIRSHWISISHTIIFVFATFTRKPLTYSIKTIIIRRSYAFSAISITLYANTNISSSRTTMFLTISAPLFQNITLASIKTNIPN